MENQDQPKSVGYVQQLLGAHRLCPGVRAFWAWQRFRGQGVSLSQFRGMDFEQVKSTLRKSYSSYQKWSIAAIYAPATLLAFWVSSLSWGLWVWIPSAGLLYAWFIFGRGTMGWSCIEEPPKILTDLLLNPKGQSYSYFIADVIADPEATTESLRLWQLDLALIGCSEQILTAHQADSLTNISKQCRRDIQAKIEETEPPRRSM